MKVVLTVCSSNYLAQAKTLGDSIKKYNPDYHVIIGLVDRVDGIDLSGFNQFELIEVERINIPNFLEMSKRYHATELNIAVRPFYLEYIFKNYPATNIILLDADILTYDSFTQIDQLLEKYDIILTPHTSRPDNNDPQFELERIFLDKGIFNLGFIALHKSETALNFLNWWQKRLEKYSFMNSNYGLFGDQLWINFIPVYYPKVYIQKDPGYNVAWWNLFERDITLKNGKYFVNEKYPLIFFHFSRYNPEKNIFKTIANSKAFTINSRASSGILRNLINDYQERLFANNYKELKKRACYFIEGSRMKDDLDYSPRYCLDLIQQLNDIENSTSFKLLRKVQKMIDFLKISIRGNK